jgi:serine protease
MSRHRLHRSNRVTAAVLGVALTLATVGAASADPGSGGQPAGVGPDRLAVFMPIHGARGHRGGGGGNVNLLYRGGLPGVVTRTDNVYLVYWGSQWNANDPSGQAAIEQSFFDGVGGSAWNNSVTQYCAGVAYGSTTCGLADTHATNPIGVLAGVWYDNATVAPGSPTQTQLASEAVRAAAHFGKTAPGSNDTVQYVINTATGNNASGFGSQYCAWHSSVGSTYGTIAYTNMPYITDAGYSCGAGFNGLGSTAGITIVGGHEFAETETDIFPAGGWTDQTGAENGDKCAWISTGSQGAAANIALSTGTFPIQSLWSNAFNGGAGGCVLAY